MNPPRNDLLLLAGKVITVLLQGFMALGAATLLVVLPAVILFRGDIVAALSDGSAVPVADLPLLPLVGVLVIAFAILAALFVFFGRLRAIINTVGDGDPFAPANAERLNLMAWLLLAAQVLTWPLIAVGLPLVRWASKLEGVTISGDFSGLDLTGVLMVLVLFILARVFRHGAAMREDLEGTV